VGEGIGRKRVRVHLDTLCNETTRKTVDVTAYLDDSTILDKKRIGDENRTRIGVTPLLDGESAVRPAINRRVDHRVKGMADGFVRRDVGVPVRAEDAFLQLIAREPHGFWLDDSLGETVSYLGLGTPVAVTNGFAELESANDVPVSRVGWISYGERGSTLGVSVGIERHDRALILDVDILLEVDHRDGSVSIYAKDESRADAWATELTNVAGAQSPLLEWPTPEPRAANWRDSPEEYAGFIAECLRHITDGDAYQLCLTTSIDVPGEIDPVGTYIALRHASPTRHGGFIRSGDVYLLSSSPETFLTVRGRVASTKPIKGTRARSMDPAEDALLKRDLLESDKERAENLMIVDLCRNDLSKVCETGSVHVPALHVVETYSTVHQLVSTVSGTLADGVTASHAAAALFPAGSMTGAPKRSAVEILNGLESSERGMYSGVFGFAGRGDLTLAMTIRSIVIDNVGATIGVGGGITAGSDPLAEIREVGVKADALLRVLGASPNSFLSAE
jgi:anthranilate synthase component 1